MGDDRSPSLEELPSLAEALEWLCAGMLTQIPDRAERERFVILMKIAWNLELLLREDARVARLALEAFLEAQEHRDAIGESIVAAIVMKQERYAEDPRQIVHARIVDGRRGEELEVEGELFEGIPGEIAWH